MEMECFEKGDFTCVYAHVRAKVPYRFPASLKLGIWTRPTCGEKRKEGRQR